MPTSQSNAMQAYVARPQPAFAWHEVRANGYREISLVSQEWKGLTWKHDMVLECEEVTRRRADVAFLVVTGDRVDAVDLPFGQKLSRKSGLPVLTLFNVPNQPLFDRREDALIAYSFEQYLETGDKDWPLLFPMVNSVKHAMDAAEQAFGIHKFIVTGSSKRGWTTWLTGALNDSRVVAIAPVAFDNLNFGAQLQHQMKTWGHLSEMLKDYVSQGLTGQAGSEQGKELIRLVDPYGYLKDIHVPVLVVRGANDPYWATDAMNLYWDAIDAPKELLVLPNEGHDFKDDSDYINALKDLSEHYQVPGRFKERWYVGNGVINYRLPSGIRRTLWSASSSTSDLREAHWSSSEPPVAPAGPHGVHFVDIPDDPNKTRAYFVMFTRKDGSKFTTTVKVVSPARQRQPS